MSDENSTALTELESTDSSTAQGFRRGPLLIVGGLGCSVLICLALLVGSGALFWPSTATAPSNNLTSEDEIVVAPEAAGRAAEFEQKQSDTLSIATSQERKSASDDLGGISTGDTPQLGRINFAVSTTKDGEPIEPDFIFEAGITEIHAVFEYAEMSPDIMWTQVWYHNGDEVLSTTQPWLEGSSGVFDYTIRADDEPFTPGEWTLELYVEDELLSAGSFLIESQNE